ncbi:response regulator [Paenibacillus sp. HJGM_3]|uniref:response regulator n=1 Tax=Paenibacillus sp. HJGM_3 TaxID=3379816 RepID=UPI00385E84C8
MANEWLTVLIVDDELPIRQELRLFPWESHGFELIGEASNGEEALRFCRNFTPDVVVTDITMPVMDGLALFRALREEYPEALVILLTCHSDFAYACEAVKLGAIEYIVKVTMGEDDLGCALDKAKEVYARERSRRRSETERQRWECSLKLRRFAQDPEAGGMTDFLWEAFGLGLPLRLTALHVEARKENRLLVKREVEETLTELERSHLPFAWVPAEDGVYLLLFEPSVQRSAGVLRDQLEAAMDALCKVIDSRLAYLSGAFRLYAVIGEPVREAADFPGCYRTVANEHPNRFYDAASRVFIADTAEAAGAPDETANAEIREKLKQQDREKLVHQFMHELPRWAAKFRIDPDTLKIWAADWLREWLHGQSSGARALGAAKALQEARTIGELIAVIVHEVETLGGKKRKLRKEIADAQHYIGNHLDQSITLPVVAEQVGLSPHYLSRLFREEAGISFNDYITKLRMDKAVHLLQTTSMRVYEVASAVGIPSYRYFNATFREHTGAAPTAYKKG